MKIVEATILIPMTIMITVSIIGLTMRYYDDLGAQIKEHEAERMDIYEETVW
ncbi:MAG: hypothetical protein IKS99_05270 [Firmicutes bacterium]|nr:hypothetical protein [Bacillota bacterium]